MKRNHHIRLEIVLTVAATVVLSLIMVAYLRLATGLPLIPRSWGMEVSDDRGQ